MTEQPVNLLPLVHRQDIPTPEALLDDALPEIIASIPNATCAQVYRLAWGGMTVWMSVDGDAVPGTFFPLEEGTPYHTTATTGESTIDGDHNLLIAPLRGRYGAIFGLLTVECNEVPASPHILNDVAEQLSSALYSKQLEQLLHRQIALTSEFSQANSLDEIASLFAKNTIVASQYVSVNAFEYAPDHTLEGVKSIVTANRAETFLVDDNVAVNNDYLKIAYASLKEDGDFLISDTQSDSRLTADDKAWLKSRNIHSIYCMALNIQNVLYGFIGLVDTKRALAPTPLEKQIYRNIAEQAATVIEKRNLLQQQEEQAFFLALLNNLMQEANLAQDEETLLQQTAKVLHDVMGYDHIGISLIDEYGAMTKIVAEYPDTGIVGKQFDVKDDGISQMLRKQLKPIELTNVAEDDMPLGISRESLMAIGVQSAIFLPMFDRDGELIGTIGVDSYSPVEAFDPQTIRTAETMISQVTVNIEKLRLLRNSQQQAKQLQQIADFGQAMQASLHVQEILQIALRYGQMALSSDYVTVLLYDRNINSLRRSALFWEDKRQVTLPGKIIATAEDTLAQKVWDEQTPIHLDELHTDWEWTHPLINTLHSILVAPIMAGGVLRGILEVGSLHSQAFSSTDIAAFRQMTNQLSVAIDNAETYSQSQRLARNKVQANEIIAHIQQQPDISAILQVTAQELGKALGAKRARIRLGMNPQGTSGD